MKQNKIFTLFISAIVSIFFIPLQAEAQDALWQRNRNPAPAHFDNRKDNFGGNPGYKLKAYQQRRENFYSDRSENRFRDHHGNSQWHHDRKDKKCRHQHARKHMQDNRFQNHDQHWNNDRRDHMK